MEHAAQSVEASGTANAPETSRRYLMYGFWCIAALVLTSVAVPVGSYFYSVTRIIGFRKVYEPPPSIYHRMVPYVVDAYFPKDHHPVLMRFYWRMYEIDRKWIRPKWWTEPKLSPQEQAAAGVIVGVPLK